MEEDEKENKEVIPESLKKDMQKAIGISHCLEKPTDIEESIEAWMDGILIKTGEEEGD